MTVQNVINLMVNNNADGWDISGGDTARKLTITGGDITLTGAGANVYTFPPNTCTLIGSTGGTIAGSLIASSSASVTGQLSVTGSIVGSSSGSVVGGMSMGSAAVTGSLVASSSASVSGGLTVTQTVTGSSGLTLSAIGSTRPETAGVCYQSSGYVLISTGATP